MRATKDNIDRWLLEEFGIKKGSSSSVEALKYTVAREVAEKAVKVANGLILAITKDV